MNALFGKDTAFGQFLNSNVLNTIFASGFYMPARFLGNATDFIELSHAGGGAANAAPGAAGAAKGAGGRPTGQHWGSGQFGGRKHGRRKFPRAAVGAAKLERDHAGAEPAVLGIGGRTDGGSSLRSRTGDRKHAPGADGGQYGRPWRGPCHSAVRLPPLLRGTPTRSRLTSPFLGKLSAEMRIPQSIPETHSRITRLFD